MNGIVPGNKANHERWLVSYADFITLLFGFFVVMYAFSKADQKKHEQVSAAIDAGFQSLSITTSLSGSRPSSANDKLPPSGSPLLVLQTTSAAKVRADLEDIRQDLLKRLSGQIAQGAVSVRLGRDGLVISLREAGFFDSGSAIPHPDTLATLHQIAESLKDCQYDVRVEGHTDNIPIRNARFDSNWELSSARATHIARLLLQLSPVSPEQISAAAYAQYHPIASNDTAAGRAENRRVDLVVMPRAVLDAAQDNDHQEDRSMWRKITGQ